MNNHSTTTFNQSDTLDPKPATIQTGRVFGRVFCLLVFGFVFVIFSPMLLYIGACFLGEGIAATSSLVMGTPEITTAHLTEQAKGENYHWFADGSKWSSLKSMSVRHPKIKAREAAILNLAKVQPLPDNARNELITLLKNGNGDFDSRDGIYSSRSALCYTLGYSAHHWDAYHEILDLLRTRALDPKLDKTSDIKWFGLNPKHFSSHTGPAAIVRGLSFTPVEYHQDITLELERLLEELDSAEVSSEWARYEIEKGIRLLKNDQAYIDFEIERFVQEAWWPTN